jgi:hypothetical protein
MADDTPINLDFHRMIQRLRQHSEAQHEHDENVIGLFWPRWGLERSSTTIAAYKLAAGWFEDFFAPQPAKPSSREAAQHSMTEAELAQAAFFYHRFCRRYAFDDIDREKLSAVSERLTPMPIREMRDAFGMGEPEDEEEAARLALYDDVPEPPDDPFEWLIGQLGLRDKPYWSELEVDIAAMNAMHHADVIDDRAELLQRAIETIVWAHRPN